MLKAVVYFCLFSCTWSLSTVELMKNFVRNTMLEIEREYNKTDEIRSFSHHTPAFEIGFVMKTMEECYRRMVDIYNSTLSTDLYNLDAHTTDHIMFLKYVENYNWILDHLSNMLHETEKKYKLKLAGMFEKHVEFTLRSPPSTKKPRFKSRAFVSMTTTTSRPKQTWWRLDYGWDQMDHEWR